MPYFLPCEYCGTLHISDELERCPICRHLFKIVYCEWCGNLVRLNCAVDKSSKHEERDVCFNDYSLGQVRIRTITTHKYYHERCWRFAQNRQRR
jgi:hypothetical protein